jgi:hypothetical protein
MGDGWLFQCMLWGVSKLPVLLCVAGACYADACVWVWLAAATVGVASRGRLVCVALDVRGCGSSACGRRAWSWLTFGSWQVCYIFILLAARL